jgi:hypothetical protein
MNIRLRLFIIFLGALVVAAIFTFPLWRPLLVNDVVVEAFPGLAADLQDDFVALPKDEQTAFLEMAQTDPNMAVEMVTGALRPDSIVPEDEQAMPLMTDPATLARGSFITLDVIHSGEGVATVYQLLDETRLLRLEDFRVTNGPDLHVILTKNPDPRDAATVGSDYIDLGQLKGNVGSQNYDIPVSVDLNEYQAVVIYCVQYRVVFTVATL